MNYQKVLFAHATLNQPKLLLLDEPSQGGVGAKQEIYNLILQASERRAPVLIVSSELEELIGLCDRILMLQEKQLFHDFRSEGLSGADLLAYCQGVSDGDKSG